MRKCTFLTTIVALTLILLIWSRIDSTAVHAAAKAGTAIRTALIYDQDVTLNANALEMFVYNDGNFAYDNANVYGKTDGLYYPRGTKKTVVYAAGIWIGANVNNQIRIAVAEYSSEFVPGPMAGGTYIPDNAEFKVYKIRRGDDMSNPDYRDWPVDQGAPVNSDGSPALLGDQMTWSVFNDANPAKHTNQAGGTLPLGIEIQHSTFAYSRGGSLNNCIFAKFKIINKGSNVLESTFVSLWADPDVGDASDDLVGCDTLLSMGYCYNEGTDVIYGVKVPAVGFDFFQGPIVPAGPNDSAFVSGSWRKGFKNLPMISFNKYINGTDPRLPTATYNYMRGLLIDGTPLVNPVTNDVTTFFVSGDPVTGQGWIDEASADRRYMMSSGPFNMAPGDTQEVVAAIMVGQGSDPLNSITILKQIDQQAQTVYNLNFDIPQQSATPSQYARGRNQEVELIWGSEPVGYISSSLPLNQEFHFEGFNIYEGETINGPWYKIGTLDVDNEVALIYSDVYDPVAGGYQRIIVQRGTNSGLAFQIILSESAIDYVPFSNYTPYYFAVTAYCYDYNHVYEFLDLNGNLLGHLTEVLESPIEGMEVIPRPVSGSVSDTAQHIAGTSDGMVVIEYLDRAQVTGHDYQVNFNQDLTWNLFDLNLNLQVLSNELVKTSGYDFPVVDGMMVRTLGTDYGVKSVTEIHNGTSPVIPPDNVHLSRNSTWEWYIDPLGDHSYGRYRYISPGSDDYEIRFLASASQYCWDYFGQGDYAFVNPFQVPIELWNLGSGTLENESDDDRVSFMILDRGDGQYGWDDGIYFWEIPYNTISWSTPGIHTGVYDPDSEGLTYRRFFFEPYPETSIPWPNPGTIVRIITNKPNTTADVFQFSTAILCGDSDASGELGVEDVVFMIQFIFNDGPAPGDPRHGDVDCSSQTNISDIVYMINFIFSTGSEPCALCPTN